MQQEMERRQSELVAAQETIKKLEDQLKETQVAKEELLQPHNELRDKNLESERQRLKTEVKDIVAEVKRKDGENRALQQEWRRLENQSSKFAEARQVRQGCLFLQSRWRPLVSPDSLEPRTRTSLCLTMMRSMISMSNPPILTENTTDSGFQALLTGGSSSTKRRH